MWPAAKSWKSKKTNSPLDLPERNVACLGNILILAKWDLCHKSNLQIHIFSLNLWTSMWGKDGDFCFTNEELTTQILCCLSKYLELVSEPPLNSHLVCKICPLSSVSQWLLSLPGAQNITGRIWCTCVSLWVQQVGLFIASYFFKIPCSYSTQRIKEGLSMWILKE